MACIFRSLLSCDICPRRSVVRELLVADRDRMRQIMLGGFPAHSAPPAKSEEQRILLAIMILKKLYRFRVHILRHRSPTARTSSEIHGLEAFDAAVVDDLHRNAHSLTRLEGQGHGSAISLDQVLIDLGSQISCRARRTAVFGGDWKEHLAREDTRPL